MFRLVDSKTDRLIDSHFCHQGFSNIPISRDLFDKVQQII